MDNILCTVYMPLYNKEKTVEIAIDSILAQITMYKYKILIIDDCSSDNSSNIVDSYKVKHPDKIEIIRNKKNEGLALVALKAYSSINTKYFTVLDPDDYWKSTTKLENAITFLEKNKDFTVYCSNTEINQNGVLIKQIKSDKENLTFTINQNPIFPHTSATFFRNSFTKKDIEKIEQHIGQKTLNCFRGDSFRNVFHLMYGKGFFYNKIESVYNITDTGIWTSLSTLQQMELNILFFYTSFLYFGKKEKQFFLKHLFNLYKNLFNMILNKEIQKIDNEYIDIFSEVLKIANKNNLLGDYLNIFYNTDSIYNKNNIISKIKRKIKKLQNKIQGN